MSAPAKGKTARPGQIGTYSLDREALLAQLRWVLAPDLGCAEIVAFRAKYNRNNFLVADNQYGATCAAWLADPDEILNEAGVLCGASGYITINPVHTDLLSRSNRLTKVRNRTQDSDVVAIRNVFIDIDPKRRDEISATDVERAAGLACRDRILAELPEIEASSAWGSSGNGGWILVALPDLPNTPDTAPLVSDALDWFAARYSGEYLGCPVEIDVKTKNAARVMALCGTYKCKGVWTVERPHRVATYDSPRERERMPLDLPEWLADKRPDRTSVAVPGPSNGHAVSGGDPFEMTVRKGRQWTPAERAEAYLFSSKFPESVSGENGHGVLYRAACVLVDGFGLKRPEAHPILARFNREKAKPPESPKQVDHKLDSAIKNHPIPSLEILNKNRDGFAHASDRVVAAGTTNSTDGDGQPGTTIDPTRLPEIVCGTCMPFEGLKIWTPQALTALAACNRNAPRIFQRGGRLTRLVAAEPGVSLQLFTVDSMRGEMDRSACWAREVETKRGTKYAYGPPPLDVVRDLLALPGYPASDFPVLDLIAESPRFLPDGSLVLQPGYHAAGRLWYAPSSDLEGIKAPECPGDAEVEAATKLLLDQLLVDFPFANKASKANALAVMLLPFVRLMINGPTPNHHFTASTEGTGKGLCAAACAFPSLGREIDLNPQKESSAEWRKALTSAFLAGVSHYFIDNLENPRGWDDALLQVDSGVLAMAWTVRYWRDRILGGNTEARIKVETVFMSSGNNVLFSRELERRNVQIELLTPCENPSLRTGFLHDPLLDWARKHRKDLTEACLTLCRRWIAEGMPWGGQTMGSYEGYAGVMGGILGCCGIEGFLKNRTRKVASNPDSERWTALVGEWQRQHSKRLTSTANLYAIIQGSSDLTALFEDTLGDGDARSQKTKLGRALEQRKGRIYGDLRIVRAEGMTAAKAALWRLQDPLDMIDDGEPEGEEAAVEVFDESRPF